MTQIEMERQYKATIVEAIELTRDIETELRADRFVSSWEIGLATAQLYRTRLQAILDSLTGESEAPL